MRTLTVPSLYRQSGEPHYKRECVVPSIRLNGKWLAALGVEPGEKIRVITNGATITLAPISFESGELTSIARPKSAVLQPESLRTGSRATRKCDLLYFGD
jgi:hypothetical protein